MKKTINTLLTLGAILFTPLATAGDKVVQPVPEVQDTAWFMAGSVGYADELDDAIYTMQLGHRWDKHSIFLEVGYATASDGNFDFDYTPVTLNYQFDEQIGDTAFGYYAGAGVGVAFSRVDFYGDNIIESSDFMAQAFVGLTYTVTEDLSVYSGVKYQWLDIDGDQDQFVYDLGLKFEF